MRTRCISCIRASLRNRLRSRRLRRSNGTRSSERQRASRRRTPP
nr:MAG TPA: hypothetical protein [Caudoviricetes sp.]